MKEITTTAMCAKLFAFCLLLCINNPQAIAQADSANNYPLPNAPKVTVNLMDGGVVKGTILFITDSAITLNKPASSAATNPQLYNDTVLKTSNNYVVLTQNIKSIKLKRNAFIAGLAIGGLIGYGLGYATGYIAYKDDDALSYDDNHDNAKNLARGVAIAGAAGVGLVGGAIAPIFARKKFAINGDRQAMQKFIKVLLRTP